MTALYPRPTRSLRSLLEDGGFAPIICELESYYDKELTNNKVSTVLNDLTTHNLVVKRSHDKFTAKYHLTDAARRALQARLAWQSTHTDGGGE